MAPAIGTPPRRHWKVNGAEPLATTDSVAVLPATTLTVCATLFAMVGATGATVSVALALCTTPAAFDTDTVKVAPLSDSCVTPMV